MTATASSQSKNRQVFHRFNEMTLTGELEHLEEVLDPEFTQVIPQCGELVRGVENVRALERYGLERSYVRPGPQHPVPSRPGTFGRGPRGRLAAPSARASLPFCRFDGC